VFRAQFRGNQVLKRRFAGVECGIRREFSEPRQFEILSARHTGSKDVYAVDATTSLAFGICALRHWVKIRRTPGPME